MDADRREENTPEENTDYPKEPPNPGKRLRSAGPPRHVEAVEEERRPLGPFATKPRRGREVELPALRRPKPSTGKEGGTLASPAAKRW